MRIAPLATSSSVKKVFSALSTSPEINIALQEPQVPSLQLYSICILLSRAASNIVDVPSEVKIIPDGCSLTFN
ncbi:hypothetical protein YPPY54_3669, partial [Yersinia pestis PY-54]